jgi:ABC-type sulfate transport system permease component
MPGQVQSLTQGSFYAWYAAMTVYRGKEWAAQRQVLVGALFIFGMCQLGVAILLPIRGDEANVYKAVIAESSTTWPSLNLTKVAYGVSALFNYVIGGTVALTGSRNTWSGGCVL